MIQKVKTNFGAINHQLVITFGKKLGGDRVMPGRCERMQDGEEFCSFWGLWITPRERFRRWKIARKAWQSRKFRNQLPLPI